MVRHGSKTRKAAAVLGNGVTVDDIMERVRRCLPLVKTAKANRKRLNTTDALTAVFLLREMCDSPGDSYDVSLEKASTKIKYAAPFFKDQIFIAWNCLGGLLGEMAIEPDCDSERWRDAPMISPSVLADALESPPPADEPAPNEHQDSGTDSEADDGQGPPAPPGSVASNASSPSGSPVPRRVKVRFRRTPIVRPARPGFVQSASDEGPKRSRRRRNGTTPPTLTGMAALCRQRLARLAGLAQDAIDAFEGTEISRGPLFRPIDDNEGR